MSRKRTNRNRKHHSIPDQRNVNHDFEDMDTMVFDFVHDLDDEDFVSFLESSEDVSEDSLFDTQDLSPTPKRGKKKSWDYLFEDIESEPVSSMDRFKTKEIPQIHRSTMYESYQATKPLETIFSTESALEWAHSASTDIPISTIHWDMPLMIRSHGHVAYVSIGTKSIRLSGVRHGRKFLVHSQNIGCWGTSGGPAITKEDKEKLMWILTEKSRYSPWMKFIFYDEGGRRIRYEKDGTRKRRTGLANMLDCLYNSIDDCDYGDRGDSSCVQDVESAGMYGTR